MSEVWKAVPGYEGLYEVSDLGRVRSLDRVDRIGRRWRGRVLRGSVHKAGYRLVHLCRDGEPAGRWVHSLVAEAFIGARPMGADIRHLDGDPANDRLGNLRYGTRQENVDDRERHGRTLRGEAHGSATLSARDVAAIRGLRAIVKQHDLADIFGVSQQHVSDLHLRKRRACG